MFFLNFSSAEEINPSLKEPILTISELNKGGFLNAPAIECNSSDEAIKKKTKNLFNQCAIDLCGDPKKNISQYVRNDQFYNSASILKKLNINFRNSLFTKVYETAAKRKLKELEELETYLENPSLDNLKIESQVHLAEEVFSPYVKITATPNEQKIENRITVTISPPKNASNELKEAINDYALILKNSVLTNPKKFTELGIYSDEDLANIIRTMIAKVKESYQSHPESLADIPKYISDISSLEKMYTNATPARALMEMNVWGVTFINNYIANKTKKDALSQIVCNTPSCKKIYALSAQENLNRQLVKKNIATYKNILKDPDTIKSAINRCKSNIIFKETERSDEKKAQQVFLAAKESVIKNLLPRFSKHSRDIMTAYLNSNLQVNNLKRSATNSLDNFTIAAEEYLKQDGMQENRDNFFHWQSLKQLNDSFENIDPLENMDACQQTTSTAWDEFIAMDLVKKLGSEDEKKLFAHHGDIDQVYASDFTCQNAEHGHHILAHEIGHALNNLVLKEKLSESSLALYNKARACITSNYYAKPVSSTDRSIYHEGDGPHSEEDTADLLAALSSPDKKTIYMCALLRKSPMGDSYSNLSFISAGARHSTSFSRVIFEAVNRDIPLPQSCQRLIDEEKPEMRFKKCEL